MWMLKFGVQWVVRSREARERAGRVSETLLVSSIPWLGHLVGPRFRVKNVTAWRLARGLKG
jgi:hypothetical protein